MIPPKALVPTEYLAKLADLATDVDCALQLAGDHPEVLYAKECAAELRDLLHRAWEPHQCNRA